MSRRYLVLFAIVVVAALALTVVSRLPRGPKSSTTSAGETPVSELSIEVRDGVVSPAHLSVPKGFRVHLSVSNTGPGAIRLELGGYARQFPPVSLEAGTTWEGEFVADQPGDDFPWMVNGEPAGMLRVTGSHLVEGHR